MARKSRYEKAKDAQWNTAFYIRLSREEPGKEESDSVVTQKQIMFDYIAGKPEFKFYDMYIDDGRTGTDFDRSGFIRMEEDIRQGYVNCVIVKDLSRMGRNYVYTGLYQDQYYRKDIRLISILDNFDSLYNNDDLMVPIKNIFNEQYAHDISLKVRSALDVKRKNGEFIGSQACYGYMKDPKDKHHLIIDEMVAPNVQLIYKLFISGMAKGSIAKELNRQGIICPSEYKKSKGERYSQSEHYAKQMYWNDTSVRLILTNQIYTGDMVQHKQTVKSFKIHQNILLDKSQWLIVPNTHEAIIDKGTWELAQKILNTDTRKNLQTGNVYLFAGLIYCGDCRRAMSVRKNSASSKTSYTYYICGTYRTYGKDKCSSHAIRYDILIDVVLNGIREQIEKYSDLEILYENVDIQRKISSKIKSNVKKINELKDKIYKAETLKQGLYEDFKAEIISIDEYFDYRNKYIEDIEVMTNELAGLEKQNRQIDSCDELAEAKKKLLRYRNVENLSRKAVLELVDSIYVFADKNITINYTFKAL
ncbi:recombinase family protein [Acetanaerobacterium elongatum]|uniref:Site-specific DNA recombinase n=1 Tax=Acetanaerobacterium elongatum TaxID=258515 RepID=A0A1H0C0E1_9FIRM|nr:recombinase family protein [Acetanaerobacterium elongatum]SDN51374.1 Site-specific DNA recombinase [Acetanaerobacterium elongatum]